VASLKDRPTTREATLPMVHRRVFAQILPLAPKYRRLKRTVLTTGASTQS